MQIAPRTMQSLIGIEFVYFSGGQAWPIVTGLG
jgi:hypothetical protein